MGFIQSGNTVSMVSRLTYKGREIMINSNDPINVKYFALGDGDIDYLTTDIIPGHVPDVTGDYTDCTLSLADGVTIVSPLEGDMLPPCFSGTSEPPPDPEPGNVECNTRQLLFCVGEPTNVTMSSNTLNCIIHLDRYMNLQNKYLSEWYDPCYTYQNGSPVNFEDLPSGANNQIEFTGTNEGATVRLSGEPYVNFYDFIFIRDTECDGSNNPVTTKYYFDEISYEFTSEADRFLWELVNGYSLLSDSTKYNYSSSDYTYKYTDYIRTDKSSTAENIYNTGLDAITKGGMKAVADNTFMSPLLTSYSSMANDDYVGKTLGGITIEKFSGVISTADRLQGCGAGGIMCNARELGYYHERPAGSQSQVEQIYDDSGNASAEGMLFGPYGFRPAVQFEGKKVWNGAGAKLFTPGVRIKTNLQYTPDILIQANPDGHFNFKGYSVAGISLDSLEDYFLIDAFTNTHGGYELGDGSVSNTISTHRMGNLVVNYDKFISSSASYVDTISNWTGDDDFYGPLMTMEKLTIDPNNPRRNASNGKRGYTELDSVNTDSLVYSLGQLTPNILTTGPTKAQLTQLTAFDHIVTQGRLLRTPALPCMGYKIGNVGTDIFSPNNGGTPIVPITQNFVVGTDYEANESVGQGFYGAIRPDGSSLLGSVYEGGIYNGFKFLLDGGNYKENSYTYQLGDKHGLTGLDLVNYNNLWKQHHDIYGYGVTLLNYERYLLDEFFKSMYNTTQSLSTNIFSNKIKKLPNDQYSVNIKMKAVANNMKDLNGDPLEGMLTLDLRISRLVDDASAHGYNANDAYVDNVGIIIERTK